jgi:hypothetical protein
MKNLIPICFVRKSYMESYGNLYTDSYTCRRPHTHPVLCKSNLATSRQIKKGRNHWPRHAVYNKDKLGRREAGNEGSKIISCNSALCNYVMRKCVTLLWAEQGLKASFIATSHKYIAVKVYRVYVSRIGIHDMNRCGRMSDTLFAQFCLVVVQGIVLLYNTHKGTKVECF